MDNKKVYVQATLTVVKIVEDIVTTSGVREDPFTQNGADVWKAKNFES